VVASVVVLSELFPGEDSAYTLSAHLTRLAPDAQLIEYEAQYCREVKKSQGRKRCGGARSTTNMGIFNAQCLLRVSWMPELSMRAYLPA
jgi:hypothetical protein